MVSIGDCGKARLKVKLKKSLNNVIDLSDLLTFIVVGFALPKNEKFNPKIEPCA